LEDVARHFYAMESRLTAGLSERMLDLARLRAGMRVLDIASGRGEPLLRATERVGPGGHVLGVDLDEQALADTLATAASRGLSNVELRVGSAEDVDERGSDAVTARWGIMYMASPERVLAAVRRALRPHVRRGVLGRARARGVGHGPAARHRALRAAPAGEAEVHRDGETIRVGGVTRIVVAKPDVTRADTAP
jgi:ubiquinone/menaquinone biosynthesis C-methylase UbiE